MFPESITTNRIRFKPMHMALDPFELYEHCNEDALSGETEYTHWSPHQNLHESSTVLSQMEDEWYEEEEANYVMFERDADEFIGSCSFEIDWEKNQANLGIWMKKEYWGERYASERAIGLIELLFEVYEVDSVIVEMAEENEKSKTAVEKYMSVVGGKKRGVIPNDYMVDEREVYDKAVYAVTQEEFESAFEPEEDSILADFDDPRDR